MNKLLCKKEAAALLNVSVRTLDYLRQNKNLPCHVIGRQIRFDERELERWALGRDTSSGDNEMEECQQ